MTELTKYGFIMDGCEVIRGGVINGIVVITIQRGGHAHDLYVSKGGRSIRIYKSRVINTEDNDR